MGLVLTLVEGGEHLTARLSGRDASKKKKKKTGTKKKMQERETLARANHLGDGTLNSHTNLSLSSGEGLV